MENINEKSVYDVVLRSKVTGKIIRTQCDKYVKYGNLRRFLAKHEDKIEVLVVDPAWGKYIDWDLLVDVL